MCMGHSLRPIVNIFENNYNKYNLINKRNYRYERKQKIVKRSA